MNKSEIRNNRENFREMIKNSFIFYPRQDQNINPQLKRIYTPQICPKYKRRSSQDIRLYDNINYLKQVYSQKSFDCMFQKLQKIGQGCHSIIYKCQQIDSEKIYAVKVIKTLDFENLKQIKDQYRIHKTLSHENILKGFYLFIDEKQRKINMVIQYCSYKDLRYYMHQNKSITIAQISYIIRNVLKGIDYLHKQGICHRDIKPDNILYNSKTGQLKLIDFQISKMKKYKNEKLQMWTNTGTIHYKAPEMFAGNYNQLIDIWAVGIITYELFFGKLPFSEEYYQDTVKAISQNQPNYQYNQQNQSINNLISFIKCCLIKNPQKRMTSIEALRTPFMLKIYQVKKVKKSESHKIKFKLSGDLNQEVKRIQKDLKKQNIQTIKQSYCQNDILNQMNSFSQDIGIRFLDW